jgi:hypothetical protein
VFPQNVEAAPPSQPVPPDAIPVLVRGGLAMAPEAEAPAAPPAAVRAAAAPSMAPRAEPAPPLPPAEVPAIAGTPPRAPATLQSRNDRTRNRAAIEARINQTQTALGQLKSRTLTAGANDDRVRATSLLELARQAVARGDLRQADDLAGRAAILARTLLDAN